MRKKILSKKNTFLACLILFLFSVLTKQAFAQITATQEPKTVYVNSEKITILINSAEDLFSVDQKYSIGVWLPVHDPNNDKPFTKYDDVKVLDDGRTLARTFAIGGFGLNPSVGEWHYKVWSGGTKDLNENSLIFSGSFKMFPESGHGGIGLYSIAMDASIFKEYTNAPLYANNIDPNTNYIIWFVGEKDPLFSGKFDKASITYNANEKKYNGITQINVGKASTQKQICIAQGQEEIYNRYARKGVSCDYPLPISVKTFAPSGTPTPIENIRSGVPTEIPQPLDIPTPTASSIPPCSKWLYAETVGDQIAGEEIPKDKPYYNDPDFKNRKCGEIPTGIGPIKTDPFDFVKSILSVLLSLSGGIAVILIIVSGYRLMTSQGNPETVKAAQEQLTSAIVGLLFIIFSLVILQVIGVDILRIPGFER